jgi:transaldolase
MELISDIVQIYRNYDTIRTEVLVASIRGTTHLIDSARLGADVATMPPEVIRKLFQHPLTDKGLAAFVKDWKATGQSIL